MAHGNAEVPVAEEAPQFGVNVVFHSLGLGEIELKFPGKDPWTELGFGRAVLRLGLFEGFDVVARVLHVREVPGSSHRLGCPIRPGRELEMHFVHVGQLVACLIHLPVIWIAAHDHDFVRAMLDRHPWTQHHGWCHIRRQRVAVAVVCRVGTVFRMVVLQHMARPRTALDVCQRLQARRTLRYCECEADRMVVDHFHCRALAHALRRHPGGDVVIKDIVFPPEPHILRIERISVDHFASTR